MEPRIRVAGMEALTRWQILRTAVSGVMICALGVWLTYYNSGDNRVLATVLAIAAAGLAMAGGVWLARKRIAQRAFTIIGGPANAPAEPTGGATDGAGAKGGRWLAALSGLGAVLGGLSVGLVDYGVWFWIFCTAFLSGGVGVMLPTFVYLNRVVRAARSDDGD